MKRNFAFPLLILFLFLLFAAPAPGEEKLSLMLDWFPNVDHVPLFAARQGGIFSRHGLSVEMLSPSDSADPLKLAAAGHVDLALSYQPQAIIAASEGIPLKAVGRLVGSPLTTLLFLDGKGIASPADLEGKTIGYTVPGMMDHLLDAFAALNGIRNFTPVNTGFVILQSLAAGKVDAVMGPFKNYEPVAMEMEGCPASFFELEKYGIPAYDELVFVCGTMTWEKKGETVKKFLDALEEALAFTAQHPQEALALYFEAVPEAPKEMESRAFEKTRLLFGPDTRLDAERWKIFADFALKWGLTGKEVNVHEIVAER
jgi:putative hydroxymethylpyrimidine transport system substrate-binding protein